MIDCVFVDLDQFTNMDMFDLENDLPDDLMTSMSLFSIEESTASSNPPATRPGPWPGLGQPPQNQQQQQRVTQQHLSHHLMQQQVSR